MDKFSSIETVKKFLESAGVSKLKAGAPSSFKVLNELIKAMNKDIFNLYYHSKRTSSALSDTVAIATDEGTKLGTLIGALQTSIDALSTDNILADLHSSTNVLSPDTTAEVNRLYGQATLEVLSEQSNIYFTDSLSNQLLSEDFKLLYAYTTTGVVGVQPADSAFTEIKDLNDIYSPVRPLIKTTPGSPPNQYVWIWLKQESKINNLVCNACEINLFPQFLLDLELVRYKNFGGVWQTHDFSYLPLYDDSGLTPRCPSLSNFRLMFDGNLNDVSDVLICVKIDGLDNWGLNSFDIKSLRYDTDSSLVIQAATGDIVDGTYTISGADLSSGVVSYIQDTDKIVINLSTTSSYKSPVINKVIFEVTP